MDESKDSTVTKNRTVIKLRNQKTALLLKIESDTVTKNRIRYQIKWTNQKICTVTKWTNQKTALLLKIESDTVTKNNGPIKRWYCYYS